MYDIIDKDIIHETFFLDLILIFSFCVRYHQWKKRNDAVNDLYFREADNVFLAVCNKIKKKKEGKMRCGEQGFHI